MQHLLEALFSIVGVLFTVAKAVSVIKAFIFIDKAVEPYVKKALVNDRADYIRAHVFEAHKPPLKACRVNQCSALA